MRGRFHPVIIAAAVTGLLVSVLWLAPIALAVQGAADLGSSPTPSASQPNQQLIAFFQSPAGVAIEVLGIGAAAIAWTVGVAQWLGRAETQNRIPTSKSARKRARARRDPEMSGKAADLAAARRVLAGLVTAAALILPVTFSILINDDVFAFPKTVAMTAFGIAIGIALIGLLVLGARPARPGILEVAVIAYLALAAIATLTALDPAHSLLGERTQYQGLVSVVDYALLITAAVIAITTVARARILALAILISSTVAAGYALIQWFGFDPIWAELYKGRVFSTVGQANALATTLAAGAIVGLTVMPADRLQRAGVLGCVALSVAGLVVTFSRGGYVAFAMGLVVAGLVLLPDAGRPEVRRWARRLIVGGAAGILVIALVALLWRPAGDLASRVIERTASIADASESSNRAHLDLWTVGLQIAIDHPLIGTGPDSYALVFPEYRNRVLSTESAEKMARFRPESPHNVYLAIASGAGFPALVAFVTLVATCFVLGLRAARASAPPGRLVLAGLFGAVTVHLVTIVFMTAEPATFALLWIMLGSLAGLGRGIGRREPSRNAAAVRLSP